MLNSDIELSAYDIAGRKIMTLEKGRKSAGIYNVTFNVEGLTSGVYIYKLTAGSLEHNRKMILLR